MSFDDNPFFTIVIPTYNRAPFIAKTIHSVLNQTYPKLELIIVDDGSTDNTSEIISRITDNRLFYFKKKNGERGAARNYGVSKSKGQYVTFLDSDDILYPNHLQAATDFIANHQASKIFCQGYEIKDQSGRLLNTQKYERESIGQQLLTGNILSCIGVFLAHDCALNFPFNEDRQLAGSEDWELWVRISCHHNILCNSKVTACMIQHEERSVTNFDQEALIQRIQLAYTTVSTYRPFIIKYGELSNKVLAHLYLYLSLHLTLGGFKSKGLQYWKTAVKSRPFVFFTKKSFAILKLIVFS